MIFIEICVGSSCHLKGSPEIVSMLENAVHENGLDDEIVLTGSFCTGKCNREGVTVTVDDTVYTGVTPENFKTFFDDKVLKKINGERS